MIPRRFLSITLIALASTGANALLIALFYRFTTNTFREEIIGFSSPFWQIMLPFGFMASMIFMPIIAELQKLESDHFHHIVRMNFFLFIILAPLTQIIFPGLSWEDWHRVITLLSFLMAITIAVWNWIYSTIE